VPARSSRPAPAEDAHRTERLLATLPEVELLGLLRGASNYTFLARLRPHEKDGLLAVYKPERGESPLKVSHCLARLTPLERRRGHDPRGCPLTR